MATETSVRWGVILPLLLVVLGRPTPASSQVWHAPASTAAKPRTGKFTLMALGDRTMLGFRSERFSVSRMIDTSPWVKIGSFAHRFRVTRQ